jgi:hypothetical protein
VLDLTYLYVACVTLAMTLAAIAIWAPRRVMVKIGALAVTLAIFPVAYSSLASLLSRPKPVTLEWARAQVADATVIASTMREGVGIYLWLQIPEEAEPRAYVLPWNKKMAQQLQDAQREAQRRGTALNMRSPFEPSWDDRDPKFYALPQPALPPKEHYAPPESYKHPGTDA